MYFISIYFILFASNYVQKPKLILKYQKTKTKSNSNEFSPVVRVNKIRETMPKLNVIPANDALDADELEDMRKIVQQKQLYLSPSPSPIPPDDMTDPEIDPDNVVTRGAYTDDELDDH